MSAHIPRSIGKKANTLIAQLQAGNSPFLLGGKRLKLVSPNLISIRLGSYRLLCEYRGQRLEKTQVLSHGKYDDYLRRYAKR